MKPQDSINYMDQTVKHDEHGVGKVIKKTGDDLKVLFEKGGELSVHKDTVTTIENKDVIDYTSYLTYASDEIKEMFNAFTAEEKKKYAEVVKHTPTQTEFHFTVKKNDESKQDAIYKINKQDKNIPESELKSGFLEKYEETGYKGPEFLANKDARTQHTPEGQGLTIARFKALVKQMPAGDFTGIGTDKPSVAIRQLYISLGGKRSEYRPVDKHGVVGKKAPADDKVGYGYKDDKGNEIIARKGYFALDGVDENGKTIVISAMKDPSNSQKGTTFMADENQMYPRITLAEQPTIKYTNAEGKLTDKDGKILPEQK